MKHMSRQRGAVLVFTGVAFAASMNFLALATPSEATTVPVCSASALSIGVGQGSGAAGNLGFPVLITNHGSTACSLEGFPMISGHTKVASPHPVTFVHTSRSQIYITAKAKLVVVEPKGTASFGISYVDALDQQYGGGPRCMMTSITIRLPKVAPLTKPTISFTAQKAPYGPINSCFAGFTFGLTPIVKGSVPPHK